MVTSAITESGEKTLIQKTTSSPTSVHGIVIVRHWAMPNSETFKIEPIAGLLRDLVAPGWVDPFANRNSPATETNDINEDMPTKHHMEAAEFLAIFDDSSVPGVLIDPPYSMRQVTEKYNGRYVKQLTEVLDTASRIIEPGGLSISFGWNSNGLGKKRGFKIEQMMIVAHGGQHNDTIVTVERKRSHQGRLFKSR